MSGTLKKIETHGGGEGCGRFVGLVSVLFAVATTLHDALEILLGEFVGMWTFLYLVKPLAGKMAICVAAYWVLWLVLRAVTRWEVRPLSVALAVFMAVCYRLDTVALRIGLLSGFGKAESLVVGVGITVMALVFAKLSYRFARVMFGSKWGMVVGALCLAIPFVLVETFAWMWLIKLLSEPMRLQRLSISGKLFSAPAVSVNIGYVVMVVVTLCCLVVLRRGKMAGRLTLGLAAVVFLGSALVMSSAVGEVGSKGANVTAGHAVPRVILIVVDTLRADAVSCLGGGRMATPALDELAKESIVFEQAYVAAPWTVPSMSSMMTGLSPLVHKTNDWESRLPDAFGTLAERMGDAGYLTWAIGSNMILRGCNMEQGFAGFDFFPRREDRSAAGKILRRLLPREFSPEVSTQDITDRAIRWVDDYGEDDFFLWVHYYDPHQPFEPPLEYIGEAKAPAGMGVRFKDKVNVRAGTLRLSGEQRDWVRKLYADEVRYVDENVGRLLGHLREAGLYDDSLIILTSDHGEEFWEHDGFEHGHTLYNEVLRVPLMIKLPGGTEQVRIAEAVSLVSVMPTILDLCGVDYEREYLSAGSLAGYWSPESQQAESEPIVCTGLLFYEDQEGVIFEGMKYIRYLVSGREELYDLRVDPRERQSLLPAARDKAEAARVILRESHLAAERLQEHYQTRGEQTVLDRATTERLRALGYVQ